MKFFGIAALVATAAAWKTDTELIKEAEGFRDCTYTDTRGIKTVCYGFNLQRGNAASEVANAGGDYNSLMNGGCTTQSVCDSLLNVEVGTARGIVNSQYGSIDCPAAQAVVVDMAYNLGSGGLSQFVHFKQDIKSDDWNGAASELQSSAYCRQVGSRCTRNMNQIKECN
mmetsp:Transcript_28762/g.43434  ORF Transcript_28762/g.43434 Transcript_28762/m.43434 type:complete len:169 (-) Transcript_28762:45-551(-)|eukprot:CAMPEP_0170480548 /NCGR_PEP_ID=MMETSP0208-20121228/1346_1 /TAXON_ID=197538 /ORGANISM="Strombidium inclinatum, Strain S3" /LENGTH=168 /DNA_ID=CAMNT_0010753115 /DNA_START=28 /DNA_END=534 /DNA_ORIENTATION=+